MKINDGDMQKQTKVHVIYLAPMMGSKPQYLWKYMNWNDPRKLVEEYIRAITIASKGEVSYQVVSADEVVRPYPLEDGYRYGEEELLDVILHHREAHQPERMDYRAMLSADLLQFIRRGKVDEVWVMGYPYAGLWEAAMGGPDPFNVNGGPIMGTAAAGRRFVVMGFNYERGVGEMLESFGHRVERTLARTFDRDQVLNWYYKRENYGVVPSPAANEWDQFLADQGTVHREAGAPAHLPDGSFADYFWHHGIEEHHRRWLGALQAEWWKHVVHVNDYF